MAVEDKSDFWSKQPKKKLVEFLRKALKMLDAKDQKIARLEKELLAKDDLLEEDVPGYMRRFRQELDNDAKTRSVLSTIVGLTRRFGEERMKDWERTHPRKLAASCRVIAEFCRDHPEEVQAEMLDEWKPWAKKAAKYDADDIEELRG